MSRGAEATPLSAQFRLIHTVGSLRKDAGGPTRTVTALCRELGRLGVLVDLVSQEAIGATTDLNLLPPSDVVTTYLARAYRLPPSGTLWSPGFRGILCKRCRHGGSKLFHDHGLWLPANHSTSAVARKLKIPLVVSTRGMLEPWALNHRAWKKRLAWSLYQRRDLATARVLHATAPHEAESLRRLGLRQPIAVIPNGVDLPSYPSRPQVPASPRVVLFLGRIHPVKGLVELVDAWRIARPAGWTMIIAGPDEGGHRAVVEERIRGAGLESDFQFVGAVDDEEKTALYQRADLFILPSFTENFGVVVAEALASGVPVITTKGTPWEGLETHRCGWWVDLGVEPLSAAIREAASLPDVERAAMGARGRRYAEHFSWPQIAEQMLAVYRWVLGTGPKPDCVRID